MVELLISCVLVALIAGAAAAALSGGFKVWQRVQAFGRQDQWIAVAFHQIRQDLRNARRFEPILFEGTYQSVSFPSLVEVQDAQHASWHEIGRTGFFLDRGRHRLCRSEQPYRFVRRRRLKDSCRSLMSDVERLRFKYYQFNPEMQTAGWVESWSSPEPPLAVTMEIRYRQPGTQRITTRSLVVHLPTAPGPVLEGLMGI